MPYQGRQPGVGVRNRFIYAAAGGQTSFSGADSNGLTLAYDDSAYVDVYLNGALLIPVTDYAATTKTSVVLSSGATASDTVEIIAYEISSIANTVPATGGTFSGNVTIAGNLSVDGGTIKLDGNYPVGSNNVALGNTALDSLDGSSPGGNNVAIGTNALTANSTGSSNTGVGKASLIANTTGENNTALGRDTLRSNTTASENVAVGYQAAYSTTTGGANTAVGVKALYLNTTAAANTALGWNAAYSNTTGAQNVAIGYQSLASNTTANNNVAVGMQTAYSTTTGGNNVAMGKQALYYNTTGADNVALGHVAMHLNTTGQRIVAIGKGALYTQNVTDASATNNVSVGYESSYSTTTGTDNTVLGSSTFYSNTTGTYNVALGRLALYSNTTSPNNTAVGFKAGYSQTTSAAGNTLIGAYAGHDITTGAANLVVTAAYASGGYYMTTGNYNTIIGGYTGNNGGLDIRTSDNNIVLSDGQGNPRMYYGNTSKAWILPYNGDTDTGRGGAAKISMSSGATAYDASIQFTDAVAYNAWFGLYNTKAYVMNVSNGVQLSSGGTAWASVSDSRLKTVTGRYTNAVSDLSQIDPVKFTWNNDDSDTPQVGVLAQSVQNVVPEAMDTTEEGGEEYLSVRYTELIPLMIASIQEQQATITALEARITALEAE